MTTIGTMVPHYWMEFSTRRAPPAPTANSLGEGKLTAREMRKRTIRAVPAGGLCAFHDGMNHFGAGVRGQCAARAHQESPPGAITLMISSVCRRTSARLPRDNTP